MEGFRASLDSISQAKIEVKFSHDRSIPRWKHIAEMWRIVGNGAPTWFDNLSKQQNTTTVAVDLRNDTSGSIAFGTTDSSKYVGSLNKIPITNDTLDGVYWTTPSVTYDVGGKPVNAPAADLLIGTFFLSFRRLLSTTAYVSY